MATQIEPATHTDEDAFRAEVQQFLADNFPAELKGQSNALAGVDGPTNETPAQTKWREAVGARGWGTPTWPKEYGGGGLTKAQAKIIDQEFAKAGAYNPIGGMGVMMFGPTLLEYGNEDSALREAVSDFRTRRRPTDDRDTMLRFRVHHVGIFTPVRTSHNA